MTFGDRTLLRNRIVAFRDITSVAEAEKGLRAGNLA